jgi:hypothetical protein
MPEKTWRRHNFFWIKALRMQPDNVFEVPGSIRKHKLFAESATKRQWVYGGKLPAYRR